jgi:alanyl-tRNA synthetase
MLGNWSFGDYYKEEAIEWAWELCTAVWGLSKHKLWATVFRDDDEAEKIWKEKTNINPKKILRFSEQDNIWEMGETGPCGPSSEIHIDLGTKFCDKKHFKDHRCQVNGGCGRFIELWNLVFIQYNRDENARLHPLPEKHVDTGMGFERIVAVLQKVHSNYDTDLFRPIIQAIGDIAALDYDTIQESQKIAFRVLSDHVRMLTFAIGDGAIPSNDGRGYVLRRILRRAARYARKINLHKPFIYKLIPVVVELMSDAFPEIEDRESYIMDVIQSEEISFNKTLDRGIDIFDSLASRIKQAGGRLIPGEEAFRLYDTYGFPLDLTRVMAEEINLYVDEDGFDREMKVQRERARKSGKFELQFDHVDNWNIIKHCASSSHFVGYEKLESETEICRFAHSNGKFHIVLTETPFYAESGGQVADKGKIITEEVELDVIDVQKQGEDIIHICEGPKDLTIVHSQALAKVNAELRKPTMYNHTATHLLHEALRRVIGKHVQQAGSQVSPIRLRFDFTHYKKIEREELEEIERLVNEQIQLNKALNIQYTTFDKAKKMGAVALFGEKYGEDVRVVSVEGFSRELCGGTHVDHTGQIGSFIIVQESSIASGVRRIEAITGPKAIEFVQKSRDLLSDISQMVNAQSEELPDKIRSLIKQVKESEKRLENVQIIQIVDKIDSIIQNAEKVGRHLIAFEKLHNVSIDVMKLLADRFRQKVKSGIILLIGEMDEKINFVCAVTDNLVKSGFHAGELIKASAKITGGGGGGRPHLATAGGKNSEKIDQAVALFRKNIENLKDIN